MVNALKTALRPIKNAIFNRHNDTDKFLQSVTGVIHIGANHGQERAHYDRFGLRVIWVEPIPAVFEELRENIRPYPKQQAIQALVTNSNDELVAFHVANNGGASSSILALKEHKDIWPEVEYEETIQLPTTTLNRLVETHNIDLTEYQALIMDTQGSEMLVLEGAVPLIRNFKYIKTEVPDFESYAGCCQLQDMNEFMLQHGFVEKLRNQFASKDGVGNYFDIVYENQAR